MKTHKPASPRVRDTHTEDPSHLGPFHLSPDMGLSPTNSTQSPVQTANHRTVHMYTIMFEVTVFWDCLLHSSTYHGYRSILETSPRCLLSSSIPGYYAMTTPNSCPLLPPWFSLSPNVLTQTHQPHAVLLRSWGFPFQSKAFQTRAGLEGRSYYRGI